jgi:hypothetical protein
MKTQFLPNNVAIRYNSRIVRSCLRYSFLLSSNSPNSPKFRGKPLTSIHQSINPASHGQNSPITSLQKVVCSLLLLNMVTFTSFSCNPLVHTRVIIGLHPDFTGARHQRPHNKRAHCASRIFSRVRGRRTPQFKLKSSGSTLSQGPGRQVPMRSPRLVITAGPLQAWWDVPHRSTLRPKDPTAALYLSHST